MAASTEHPCFIQPNDSSVKLWRYMDFTKYVSLLSSSSIFLSRADLLGDPFEGSYSKANILLRPSVYKDVESDVFIKQTKTISDFIKWSRQWTYINCWHMNDTESAAMWKLYSKSNESVAIQTNYSRLVNTLPNDVFVGLVKYIDYEKDWLPEGNSFYPFMHKRKSFSYENEVRIINSDLPTKEQEILVGKINEISGINIKINLNELIDNIYVAPTAPKWYYHLVSEITLKFNIDKKIRFSILDETPVY